MDKLAGRMTYLGFGALAGVCACAVGFKYFSNEFDVTATLQVLISVAAVIAAGLSAFAAHNVASISKETHQRFKETSSTRRGAAKDFLLGVIRNLEPEQENPSGVFTMPNTLWFDPADELLDKAVDEPVSAIEYMSLWAAKGILRRMHDEHTKHGGLITQHIPKYIKDLRECADDIGY